MSKTYKYIAVNSLETNTFVVDDQRSQRVRSANLLGSLIHRSHCHSWACDISGEDRNSISV